MATIYGPGNSALVLSNSFTLDDEVQILSAQTPFMRELFSQVPHLTRSNNLKINDQPEDSFLSTDETLPSIFRHSMITDAAHKFSDNGKLVHILKRFIDGNLFWSVGLGYRLGKLMQVTFYACSP